MAQDGISSISSLSSFRQASVLEQGSDPMSLSGVDGSQGKSSNCFHSSIRLVYWVNWLTFWMYILHSILFDYSMKSRARRVAREAESS